MNVSKEMAYFRSCLEEAVTSGQHTMYIPSTAKYYSLDDVCALCGHNPLLMNFRATCSMVLETKVLAFQKMAMASRGEHPGTP